MTKDSMIVKIILLSILGIALVTVLISLLAFGGFQSDGFFQFHTKSKLIYDERYNIQTISELDIDTVSSDINIIRSNEPEVRVVAYGAKKDKVNVIQTEEQLKIEVNKKRKIYIGIFLNFEEHVDVYVPMDYKNSFILKTTSGDIDVQSFSQNDMTIKSVSGDVNVGSVKNLEVRTTSGDIEVKKARNPKISTISGDVNINKISNYLNIKTTSGDIYLGNINITKNSKINTISGEVEIEKANSIYVETSTISGDVNVYSNNRKADIILTIKTTSGDIRVN